MRGEPKVTTTPDDPHTLTVGCTACLWTDVARSYSGVILRYLRHMLEGCQPPDDDATRETP